MPDIRQKSPSATFLGLPSEIRNEIYALLLVHHEAFDATRVYCQPTELETSLLLVSKIISREASSLFYARNTFDFSSANAEYVARFLKHIGGNAAYIRHLRLDFPMFHAQCRVRDEDIAIFANISLKCTSLSTITIGMNNTSILAKRLALLKDPKHVTQALASVNNCFNIVPSIRKVVVEVFGDDLNENIRDQMIGHGWILKSVVLEVSSESEEDDSDDDDDDDSLREYDSSAEDAHDGQFLSFQA
jgi:hypothetical protein